MSKEPNRKRQDLEKEPRERHEIKRQQKPVPVEQRAFGPDLVTCPHCGCLRRACPSCHDHVG